MQTAATLGNVISHNQSIGQAIQGAKSPVKMAQAIQKYPEIGAVLDAYQKGEYHNLSLSQDALQALADATGISTEVLLTDITLSKNIKGATNQTLTVIDTNDSLRQDSIQTLSHELDHVRGGKSETLANLAGLAGKLNTSAAISANKDNIKPIQAQLGDGQDVATVAQNQALLDQNNKTFNENYEGKEGDWDFAIIRGTGKLGERIYYQLELLSLDDLASFSDDAIIYLNPNGQKLKYEGGKWLIWK